MVNITPSLPAVTLLILTSAPGPGPGPEKLGPLWLDQSNGGAEPGPHPPPSGSSRIRLPLEPARDRHPSVCCAPRGVIRASGETSVRASALACSRNKQVVPSQVAVLVFDASRSGAGARSRAG
jgi:hypothetical protein